MSTRVINAVPWARTSSGQRDTDPEKIFSDAGTITAIYENQTYTFGPGESKVLEDGIAAGVVAFDGRLRIADTRDGRDTDRS